MPHSDPFHSSYLFHYLGLFHTFQGGCDSGSCYTQSDLICDTNSESGPHFGCSSGTSSCGSVDPIENYMDYSDDACMTEFTGDLITPALVDLHLDAESTLTAIMGREAAYTGKVITFEDALNSDQDLMPNLTDFTDMPTPPVPIPGQTRMNRSDDVRPGDA